MTINQEIRLAALKMVMVNPTIDTAKPERAIEIATKFAEFILGEEPEAKTIPKRTSAKGTQKTR